MDRQQSKIPRGLVEDRADFFVPPTRAHQIDDENVLCAESIDAIGDADRDALHDALLRLRSRSEVGRAREVDHVENLIRPTALGKKNWLFMGNEDSGLIHALWYSLILSAIKNNLNPRVYIHFILTKIHDLRTGRIDPIDLLPHTIDRMQLIAFANEQIALSKEVIDSS